MRNKMHLAPHRAIPHIRSAAARAALDYKLKNPEIRGEHDIPRLEWIEMTKQNTTKRLCNMFPGTTPEEIDEAFNRAVEFLGKVPYVDEPEHREMLDKLSKKMNIFAAIILVTCLAGFGAWQILKSQPSQPSQHQPNLVK